MIQRFTEKSLEAMNRAQEEAKKIGQNFVGTDQIILGLVQADSALAGKVFEDAKGHLDNARKGVEKIINQATAPQVQPEIPLSPGAKKIVERAWEEAKSAGKTEVGTEHLMLAALLEGGDAAAQTLGVDGDKLKWKLFRMLGSVKKATQDFRP